MHVARAVSRKNSIVGVDLGGPKHVRIVFGAVEGVQEVPGSFLACSSNGPNAATYSPALPFWTVTRATIATRDTNPPSLPVCLDGSCYTHQRTYAVPPIWAATVASLSRRKCHSVVSDWGVWRWAVACLTGFLGCRRRVRLKAFAGGSR